MVCVKWSGNHVILYDGTDTSFSSNLGGSVILRHVKICYPKSAMALMAKRAPGLSS